MSFIKFLLFMLVLSSTECFVIVSAQTTDRDTTEFGSLFDIKEADKNPEPERNKKVCDTRECRIIANDFLRGMDMSVDPCDDLFNFVCGAWKDRNEIPKYEVMWTRYLNFQEVARRRIRDILLEEPQASDILPLRQAKKWYRSCMDIGTLENRGIKPMEAMLLQVGGWPMTLDPEEWNENEHTWQSVEHDYFHITGKYVFYEVSLWYSSEFKIQLERGSIPMKHKLPLQYRNYTGDDYETYVNVITDIADMFVKYNKAAVTDETIEANVRDMVEFEKQLYLLANSIERDHYDNWTIAGFVQWYNVNLTELGIDGDAQKIDFESIIRRQFDLVNREISDSDIVIVDNHHYYVQLTELLKRTPTRTIVNYIHWHVVSDMLAYTTEAMRDAFFRLMKNEYDAKERKPRWLECIDEMELNNAAAYAFVQRYFSPEVEEIVRNMIANVREEMGAQIDGSNWMDKETKESVKQKLESMKVHLGFPDWYKNETTVLNSYRGLTIGHDHFDNILSYRRYKIKKSLQEKRNMYSEDEDPFSMIDPTIVNAYYSPWSNEIVLPAALFQSPLFTSRVPSSVNYGIIGLAVGHEMGHGFDSEVLETDEEFNRTVISPQMLELFDERAECFVKQFNEYYNVTEDSDSDEMSRGRVTRPDNLADSTGIHSVFKAYRKWSENNPSANYQLPGFEQFSGDQMFFISFAAVYCESVTPKMAEKMALMDRHSPGRLRVIGAVSNTNDFAEAFNCPVGSAMNPENKCNIWQSPVAFDAVNESELPKRRRRLGWIRRS